MRLNRMRRPTFALAMILAIIGSAATPFAAISPARADQVRQKESWVLNALDVPAAWRSSQGRGVLVAVIDSGVDPAVSDLSGSVTSGRDFTGVHTPMTNPHWGAHGTWMASLIAGHGHGPGHRDGLLGVAPQARILSIRVITDKSDPGYHAYQHQAPGRGQWELARAIRYAVHHHAGVISMSLGYNLASADVRAAIQFALSRNVVLVASSGNSGGPPATHRLAPYSFPADYPGVIGVAAINMAGLPAHFSSDNLSVQVSAPGVNVPAEGRGSHYWLVSGTSPACALTAGVAALIKAKFPRLTAGQVRRAITESAAHRPPGGYDDQVGFGTVDAAAALAAAGRLARRVPGGQAEAARARSVGYFGGGAAKVPQVPVAPRDRKALYKLLAIAAGCLLIALTAMWRFAAGVVARRKGKPRAAAPAYPAPLTAMAAAAGPAGGLASTLGPAGYPVPGLTAPWPPGYPAPGSQGPGYPAPGSQGPGYPAPGPQAPGYNPAPGPQAPGYNPAPGPQAPGYNPAPGPQAPGYNPAPGPQAPGPPVPGYPPHGVPAPQAGPIPPSGLWPDQGASGQPPVVAQPPDGSAAATGLRTVPGQQIQPPGSARFDPAGLHQWRQMYAQDQSPQPTADNEPSGAASQLWPEASQVRDGVGPAEAPAAADLPGSAQPPASQPVPGPAQPPASPPTAGPAQASVSPPAPGPAQASVSPPAPGPAQAAGSGQITGSAEPSTVRAPALPKRVKPAAGAVQPGDSSSARLQPGQDLFTRPDFFARGQESATAEPPAETTADPSAGPASPGEALWGAWTPAERTDATSPRERDPSDEA
jgi:hypothetical protein